MAKRLWFWTAVAVGMSMGGCRLEQGAEAGLGNNEEITLDLEADGGTLEADGGRYTRIEIAQGEARQPLPLNISNGTGNTCASAPVVSWLGSPVINATLGTAYQNNDPDNCMPVHSAFTVPADQPSATTADLVFAFSPPKSGTFRIDVTATDATGATTYPTRVLVTRGACSNGQGLACADDLLSWTHTATRIDALADVTHFVRIDVRNPWGNLIGAKVAISVTEVSLGLAESQINAANNNGNTCTPHPLITNVGVPALQGLIGVFDTNIASNCTPHDAMEATSAHDFTFEFVAPSAGTYNIVASGASLYPAMIPGYPMVPTPGVATAPAPAISLQMLGTCGGAATTCNASGTSGSAVASRQVAATAGQHFFFLVESNAASGRYVVSINKVGVNTK